MPSANKEKVMQTPRFFRWAALATLAFVMTGPLAAYTIYLKDGSTVQSKGKYRIQNGKAYITLANGTQSFIDAKEIDVKRTEEANKSDYGGNAVILQEATPPADGTAPVPQTRRLSDVIASRGSELPGPQREPVKATTSDKPAVKTRAGYVDFSSVPRRLLEAPEVSNEIRQFFSGQGVKEVEVFAGTTSGHPLVQVTASSENSVFKGLAVAANAILHIRDRFPGQVAAFDLLLITPGGERAGQFVLTPEMASELVSKKVELAAFYIENVQF
jgi:hypothetical protein